MLVRPDLAAARATLIEQVRVFDGERLSEPRDVLLLDGRIASGTAPAGVEHVDGRGKTLLPGLIDCHVHLGGGDGMPPWAAKRPNVEAQAAALLYSGVTTILAAAHDADVDGLRVAPRIVKSSRIFTAPGGHPVPMYEAFVPWPVSWFVLRARVAQVESEKEVEQEIEKETDVAFVKIVYDDIPPGGPRLSKELLAKVIASAHAHGKRASVHVGSPQEAIDAVEAGADLLMHVPADAPLTDAQAEKLLKVPLVTTSRIYAVLGGKLAFTLLEKQVMPPGTEEAFAHPPQNFELPGFPRSYLESFEKRDGYGRANVKLLFDKGAHLIAGTDSGLPGVFHGAALHRELQSLVSIGIPPARALRMATIDAARVIDPHADYGAVEPGLRADLVMIDGDPLADIAATEKIVAVWQDGRRVR